MNVVILGSRGLVGGVAVGYLRANTSYEVKALDHHDLDVTNAELCKEVLSAFRPDVVVNATGFLNADRCEEHPDESYAVNVRGVLNIARALMSVRPRAMLIHFSSDFVFDGNQGAYSEAHLPRPMNVYGMHKWLADELLSNSGLENLYILRIASVIGWNDERRQFLKSILTNASNRSSLEVVADLRISMTTPEFICDVIAMLASRRPGRGLYNCVTIGETSWYEIAKYAVRYFHLPTEVLPMSRDRYRYVAARPVNSTLSPRKLLAAVQIPDWVAALGAHLAAHRPQYTSLIDEVRRSRTK